MQIEARTRQDIEDKNLQLRQLVGDSYRWVGVGDLCGTRQQGGAGNRRGGISWPLHDALPQRMTALSCCRDLINGTDKIIDISTKCHSILDSILAIQVRGGTQQTG